MDENNIVCVYHRVDLDGQCSAAIVKKRYPEAELIGWNYGDEIPWDRLKGKDVIMVDLAFQPNDLMIELLDKAHSLVWIDHHKSAIKDAMDSMVDDLAGMRIVGYGACELTWKFFFPEKKMPQGVRLLGLYDTWKWKDEPKGEQERILNFQFGMRGVDDTTPTARCWDRLFRDTGFALDDLMIGGRYVRTYQQKQDEAKSKSAFETILVTDTIPSTLHGEMQGSRVLALMGVKGSQAFDPVWEDHPDCQAMMAFEWRKGQWHVALYSDRGFDCGEVCKAFGGGGHKGAGGFQCATLPFDLR